MRRRSPSVRPAAQNRDRVGQVIWLGAALLMLAFAALAVWLFMTGRASDRGVTETTAFPPIPGGGVPDVEEDGLSPIGQSASESADTEAEDAENGMPAVGSGDDGNVYYRRRNDRMEIALSFDDGPHPVYTREILSILEEYGVTATFFMVGENVLYYTEAAEAVLAAGHEIGNHSYDHRRLTKLDEAGVRSQVMRCEEALASLGEYRPHLLRPPEGAMNATVRRVAREEEYRLILWDIDTRDWAHTPPDVIAQNVLHSVQAGDIILMHDYIGHDSPTPAALRRIIPALLEQGYRFVTISHLIDG